jgi:hypothetical protein
VFERENRTMDGRSALQHTRQPFLDFCPPRFSPFYTSDDDDEDDDDAAETVSWIPWRQSTIVVQREQGERERERKSKRLTQQFQRHKKDDLDGSTHLKLCESVLIFLLSLAKEGRTTNGSDTSTL